MSSCSKMLNVDAAIATFKLGHYSEKETSEESVVVKCLNIYCKTDTSSTVNNTAFSHSAVRLDVFCYGQSKCKAHVKGE